MQVHKVKPETLKSILSLARNSDSASPAVDGRVDGERSRDVTSQCRDAGSDDVISRDDAAVGDAQQSDESESSQRSDQRSDPRSAPRSGIESFEPSQDRQMRLAAEGQSALRDRTVATECLLLQ